jgi:tRNA(Arg) A34 adenosine deaminase TadA
MLPEGVPDAVEAIRTYKVVLATALFVADNVTVDPKPDDEEFETSNPVGAVTVTEADKLLPETVNDCTAEAEPVHAEKAVMLPAMVTEGNWDCWVTER